MVKLGYDGLVAGVKYIAYHIATYDHVPLVPMSCCVLIVVSKLDNITVESGTPRFCLNGTEQYRHGTFESFIQLMCEGCGAQ